MRRIEAEELSRVERECFSEPWETAVLRGKLESGCTVCRAAYEGEAPVGFALGELLGDEAELYRLAVLPRSRRKGLGERLLREFLGECRERGAQRVFLEVRSGNVPAVSLYEKAGFVPIAVRKGYYGDDDAVVMRFGDAEG